ncbi:hypothetical protein NECID01_0498 [Nematocida sp. AWRm77]|nr:hypothetical protein NECID01_0498 [Nematocida sp. AWRm77]
MNKLRQALQKKDALKRAASMCSLLDMEEHNEVALVPTEPNFQLSDMLLSTKILPECETYFMQHSQKMGEKEIEEWNSKIEGVLEQLSIEIDVSFPRGEKENVSEKVFVERIESILKYD